MMTMENIESLLDDLKKYHPCIYYYIVEYKTGDEEALTDFKIFNDEERQIILKILKVQGKNIQNLTDYHSSVNDELARIFKHIMLCEVDDNFMNDPKNVDIRFFFRKLLLCYEKKMSTSMKECVSLVLDYTFDPNNTYLQQDFLHFSLVDQLILLQDILCKQKILNYHTMYYEQNCCYFVEQYTKIFLSTLSRRGNNPYFHNRRENEFIYMKPCQKN